MDASGLGPSSILNSSSRWRSGETFGSRLAACLHRLTRFQLDLEFKCRSLPDRPQDADRVIR